MAKKTEKSERSRFGKICSVITDILVFPVIIIAFACAIFMSSAKANNKVPSIFGNSIVEVLTNSMDLGTPQSYKVGDVLIINQNINLDQIEVGDCLAFRAPKQSGFVDNEGNSLIIFHRVVRIVYVNDNDINKRYFVCHGDNAGPLTFVPAQNIEESTHNAEGNIEPGGGYVVKLLDDDELATNQDHTLPNSQAQMQYVADEFVVGKFKSRASGLVTGLIKFCTSTIGITAMVIIPSMVMIGLVVINMVRETKAAKKENEDDTLVFAQSMVGAEGSVAGAEISPAENLKEENNNIVKDEKVEAPKKPESQKTVDTKAPPKAPESQPAKEAPKKDVQSKEKVAPKKVSPAPAAPKPAPAKTPAAPKAPASTSASTPKSAPTPAAPKPAPAKSAPAKAPAAPKAPATPKPAPAPKAVPTKAPPKKG